MEDRATKTRKPDRSLAVLKSVSCLGCGAVYSKPASGGTVLSNPGCPECGYVGWLPLARPVTSALEPRRAAAALPRPRPA